MTRNEMIMEIATALIMKDSNIDYKKAQELAEVVLSRMLELGMSPPEDHY